MLLFVSVLCVYPRLHDNYPACAPCVRLGVPSGLRRCGSKPRASAHSGPSSHSAAPSRPRALRSAPLAPLRSTLHAEGRFASLTDTRPALASREGSKSQAHWPTPLRPPASLRRLAARTDSRTSPPTLCHRPRGAARAPPHSQPKINCPAAAPSAPLPGVRFAATRERTVGPYSRYAHGRSDALRADKSARNAPGRCSTRRSFRSFAVELLTRCTRPCCCSLRLAACTLHIARRL